MHRTHLCIAVVVVCATASTAQAQNDFTPQPFDWPQWQGPKRNALCRETGLLKSWPKSGPPLLWKCNNSGAGFVTPSVAAGRIFLMGDIDKTEYIICLSEKNGDELWKTATGPVRSNGGGYPGPRCTPTVDGEWLYALGLNGDLVCARAADGQERWRKDLRKHFSGSPGGWGYTESPLVDGDKLLVTPGGKKNSMVALDKTTGNLIWSAQVPEGDGAGYSSIIVAEIDGQRQYVQFLSRGVVGIAAVDGKFLWRYNKPANGTANISTPLVVDDMVFASSDYGTGGGLVKISRTKRRIGADEVYFTKQMKNHHGGMVLLHGYLYGANSGQLCCLELATGKVMWQSKNPGKGSIAFADGCLYYRNEGGDVYLIEANPEQYVQLGSFRQPQRSNRNAWAHPVIANGRLYIADQELLLCYDVKKK
jgi:outer membrane protein assembly factor BamB